mmetsp:Transcript_12237/g.26470  ORF Transcript_12237/g.26470 Transcript_12237/m.26470 type:complete len:108 (-) Transcript_12237:45-368(-)
MFALELGPQKEMATTIFRIRPIRIHLARIPTLAMAHAFAIVAIGGWEGAPAFFATFVFEQGNVIESSGRHPERFGKLRARMSTKEGHLSLLDCGCGPVETAAPLREE